MSKINNQIQDFYSIESVQDLDHEAAATVIGGALVLTSLFSGKGTRRTFTKSDTNLAGTGINNIASWARVTGNRDWLVYTRTNFRGLVRRLKAGSSGNLPGFFNNNIESIRPA